MAKLHDILINLKAQVGAISAPRSAAPTVITYNRERPVRNNDGASKEKRSNPTSEQGGGNGGGQIPPRTMQGAGDPDPDDGDNADDRQDPKGGQSRKEKGLGLERQDPETGDEEEDLVNVMAKAID